MNEDGELLCPSAQPDQPGSSLIGVVEGTAEAPRVTYVGRPLPVLPEILALAGPVAPTEVFRFAAPCAGSGCQHFDGGHCRLAEKFAKLVDGTDFGVPKCGIRPRCRWWREQGVDACARCPAVVTTHYSPSPAARLAADPTYLPFPAAKP